MRLGVRYSGLKSFVPVRRRRVAATTDGTEQQQEQAQEQAQEQQADGATTSNVNGIEPWLAEDVADMAAAVAMSGGANGAVGAGGAAGAAAGAGGGAGHNDHNNDSGWLANNVVVVSKPYSGPISELAIRLAVVPLLLVDLIMLAVSFQELVPIDVFTLILRLLGTLPFVLLSKYSISCGHSHVCRRTGLPAQLVDALGRVLVLKCI